MESFKQSTILRTIVGFSVLSISCTLGGCSGDSTSTASNSASSSSSSSTGGTGGEGGSGMGGMGMGGMGTAGMGGMGMGGAGGQGGGVAACDKPMNNPCFECIYDSCGPTYCECANNAACPNIVPCIQQCPAQDDFCRNICYQNNSIGFAEFLGISNCAGTTCAASCQGAKPVGACEFCLAQTCEQELEACYGNPACTTFIDCVRACPAGNMMCTDKCAADYPAGLNQATQLRNCSLVGCTNVCN